MGSVFNNRGWKSGVLSTNQQRTLFLPLSAVHSVGAANQVQLLPSAPGPKDTSTGNDRFFFSLRKEVPLVNVYKNW